MCKWPVEFLPKCLNAFWVPITNFILSFMSTGIWMDITSGSNLEKYLWLPTRIIDGSLHLLRNSFCVLTLSQDKVLSFEEVIAWVTAGAQRPASQVQNKQLELRYPISQFCDSPSKSCCYSMCYRRYKDKWDALLHFCNLENLTKISYLSKFILKN